MNVYQRLNAARTKFHELPLKKTGHNKFAGYNYFELGDFLIPALKVFADAGLCATVSFDTDVASMAIRNAEKPDDCVVIYSPMGSAALKGCHEVQNIGAVETYQRRYLWVAALEIVEHDALDATTGKAEPERRAEPQESALGDFSRHDSKVIRAAAGAAIRAFDEGNEWAAYEEVAGCLSKFAPDDQSSVLLAMGSIFKPHSALRASLKKHMEAERERQRALSKPATTKETA
jgi:hypothetical protein